MCQSYLPKYPTHLPSRLFNILSIFYPLVELVLHPLLMASSSSPLPSPLLTLKSTSPRSTSLPSTLHLPSDQPASLPTLNTNRRELLVSVASISTLLTSFHKPSPSLAREVEVGAYLPSSPSDPSFVVFKASPTDTPALRAGTCKLLLLPLMCLQCTVVQSTDMVTRSD